MMSSVTICVVSWKSSATSPIPTAKSLFRLYIPYPLLSPADSRRRTSKVAWDLCPERVQELAGYPLNGRPSAVTMLELLYNGVARYDDLSILK